MFWSVSLSPRALWLARLTSLLCILVLLAVAAFNPSSEPGRKPLLRTFWVEAGVADRRRLRTNSRRAAFGGDSRSPGKSAIPPDINPAILPARAENQESGAAARQTNVVDGVAPAPSEAATESYVALCLAVKTEEESELRHWIQHHVNIGVGKFYVFDESSTSLAANLRDLTDSGLVSYQQLSEKQGQLQIYASCLTDEKRRRHKFIGFIDADEYLVLRDASDLPSLLKQHEGKHGGLGVNWRLMGSSGHLHKPSGPVTENFWKCVPRDDPQSRQIKSIVSTQQVASVGPDPHTFVYRPGFSAASTSGLPINGFLSDTFEDKQLVLFHYVTKSREEFSSKMVRGSGMGNHRKWDFFDEMDRLATDDCTDLLVPERPRGRQRRSAAAA